MILIIKLLTPFINTHGSLPAMLLSRYIEHEDVPGLQKLTDSIQQKVSKGFYGNVVDEFYIGPRIAPQEEYDKGLCKSAAMCDWRIGKVSLFIRMSIDFEEFYNAPAEEKVYQTVRAALEAIKHIKSRSRGKLDCNKLIRDIFNVCDKYTREKLLTENFELPLEAYNQRILYLKHELIVDYIKRVHELPKFNKAQW